MGAFLCYHCNHGGRVVVMLPDDVSVTADVCVDPDPMKGELVVS